MKKYWVEKCPDWFSKDFDWAVAYRDIGETLYASLHIKKQWALDFSKELNKSAAKKGLKLMKIKEMIKVLKEINMCDVACNKSSRQHLALTTAISTLKRINMNDIRKVLALNCGESCQDEAQAIVNYLFAGK